MRRAETHSEMIVRQMAGNYLQIGENFLGGMGALPISRLGCVMDGAQSISRGGPHDIENAR